jgi:hypothetical protein
MQEKYPDMRMQQAITDLNQQFIRLLTDAPIASDESLLGMPGPFRASLARLEPKQLSHLGNLPCLLAEHLPPPSDGEVAWIAEQQPGYVAVADEWLSSLCMFTAEMLTFIWHSKQRDPVFTAIATGLEPAEAQLWDQVSFTNIERRARQPLQTLRVRFARHPRFWPDLISAARRGTDDIQQVAQLASLPLSVADCWQRQQQPLGRRL